jgi:hypothetical protein
MITRRQFLGLGVRAATAAAVTFTALKAQNGGLLPPRPASAGHLEYTVTALSSGVTSDSIAVTLQPQGAPLPAPTPTPFSAGPGAAAQVQSVVAEQTPIASLTSVAGGRFRLSVERAENLDGARFSWDLGGGNVQTGASVDLPTAAPGALHGTLTISSSAGDTLAQVPLVRLVAYDTPPLLSGHLPHIGVQAHVNFDQPADDGLIGTIPDVQKAIARMKDMGMDLVRTDWIWSKLEPADGAYNWNTFQYEDVLRLLASNGLGSLAILKGTPQWCSAESDHPFPVFWNAPPVDPRIYGRFVYNFVDHFAQAVKMIEIYQEPNVSLYWNFDAAGLAACQKEGYLHAKYANPDVTVGLTGLVGVPAAAVLKPDGYWHYGSVLFQQPQDFMSRVYQATGGRVWWDVLGLHTYPDMDQFSSTTGFNMARSIAFINSMKAVKAAYRDTTPFAVTEIGTSTPSDRPSPQLVARFMDQLIDVVRQNTDTPIIIWYRLNEGPSFSSPDDRRGLATYDLLRLTPIGQAMKTFIATH